MKYTYTVQAGKLQAVILTLALVTTTNAYAIKVCKDESGRTYFTDVGCPEGMAKQDKLQLNQSNTYSTRESINIDLVNDYESRHKTGRSWRWVNKQPGGCARFSRGSEPAANC